MAARSLCRWKKTLVAGLLWAAVLDPTPASNPAQEPELPLPALWDNTINLRAGIGYKDNVLLSAQEAHASAYFASGLDVMIMRLPTAGTQFYWFLTGDDLRYLSEPGVDKEQTLISQAELKREFSPQWQSAVDLQYLYQNQVFDASLTEAEFATLQAQGHRLTVYPSVQRCWAASNRLELQWTLSRQYFKQPLDSYWETGPKLTWGRTYGYRSEVTLSYEILHRPYDHRLQATADGTPIPGESLSFLQQEFAGTLQHYWDARRRWRTATKLGYAPNRDRGSGYFDYHRYQVSQQVRYRARTWEVSAQVKLSQYDYARQTVSATDVSPRHKTLALLSLHGEKSLSQSLKWYADFEHENSLSNLAFDAYHANLVSSGVDWEF